VTTFGWNAAAVVAALWYFELRGPTLWQEIQERLTLDTGEADQGSPPGPPTSPVSSGSQPWTWMYWSLLDRAGEAAFRTRRPRS
jgi:hypothetical protein